MKLGARDLAQLVVIRRVLRSGLQLGDDEVGAAGTKGSKAALAALETVNVLMQLKWSG